MSCIEGFEKKNVLTGKYVCLENGEWDGVETVCVFKDCGSRHWVSFFKRVQTGTKYLDTVK